MSEHYADINARAMDKWVSEGWEWGVPISSHEYAEAKAGRWGVLLTPQTAVPKGWFAPYLKNGRLDGVSILGLASGGGQQMPVFAALGAKGCVLDYSDSQLESERAVAAREGYEIEIVKADMSKPLPFEMGSFDIIFHPVSNSYVEDARHVWRECFRVLKPGGLLLAGVDNGVNYLLEEDGEGRLIAKNKLPYNPLSDPETMKNTLEIDGSVQFSHSLEEQIGGQLEAGFILTNLYEDRDREGAVSSYCPQYIATRGIKP